MYVRRYGKPRREKLNVTKADSPDMYTIFNIIVRVNSQATDFGIDKINFRSCCERNPDAVIPDFFYFFVNLHTFMCVGIAFLFHDCVWFMQQDLYYLVCDYLSEWFHH